MRGRGRGGGFTARPIALSPPNLPSMHHQSVTGGFDHPRASALFHRIPKSVHLHSHGQFSGLGLHRSVLGGGRQGMPRGGCKSRPRSPLSGVGVPVAPRTKKMPVLMLSGRNVPHIPSTLRTKYLGRRVAPPPRIPRGGATPLDHPFPPPSHPLAPSHLSVQWLIPSPSHPSAQWPHPWCPSGYQGGAECLRCMQACTGSWYISGGVGIPPETTHPSLSWVGMSLTTHPPTHPPLGQRPPNDAPFLMLQYSQFLFFGILVYFGQKHIFSHKKWGLKYFPRNVYVDFLGKYWSYFDLPVQALPMLRQGPTRTNCSVAQM